EPVSVVLSQKAEYIMQNGHMKLIQTKETYQYIPILKTLKALLNHPDILDEIYNTHESKDGLLRDFCDGQDFKEHPLFGKEPRSIVLHGYFDEFQLTNPLGSKTKTHKLGGFYFILSNLRPCYRSRINSIQLFALCKVPLIKKYGIDKILQPFMDDVKCLESDHGITVEVDNVKNVFRGSIGPFSSDNLGSHAIGGYTESFNCLRICRFCMATKEDIQTKNLLIDTNVSAFPAQPIKTHNQNHGRGHKRHCNLVENNPSFSSVYGVKRDSILNQSKFFHVVDGLDLDPMHDQLEGVLPLELKMLLFKYIQSDKMVTLTTINERIASFDYGLADATNKPSPLKDQVFSSNSASISQTASQMWCLARMFPLLVGDIVPHGDKNWENFLRLLQIEEIVFAPKLSAELASYLGILVQEYLETFADLYDRTIIPKQHYMVHYPRQILRRGPLVRNWAMRFEAKHSYFKNVAGIVNNFKNIDLSLARRHQALQAYLLQGKPGSLTKPLLEHGPGRVASEGNISVINRLSSISSQTQSSLSICPWIRFNGTRYAVGCVIVIELEHSEPVFGKVMQIIVIDNSVVIFKYSRLLVVQYVDHLNAYDVMEEDVNEGLILHEKLADFHPLATHQGFGTNAGKTFVILRYRIDCMQ
ncbi:Hypothetical predicted protein, partial [Paramuricea clavata]